MGRSRTALFFVLLFVVSLILVQAIPEAPSGITEQAQTRRTPGAQGYAFTDVWAGNITKMVVQGNTVTRSWAGFIGNVSGNIVLDDALNETLYDWTLNDPEGEIYATTSTAVSWVGTGDGGLDGTSNLRCWDFTETQLEDINRSELEQTYGIDSDDEDGVDETFSGTYHDSFYVGDVNFTANSCRSTSTYSNEIKNINLYQEMILYDDSNNAIIWTTIMEGNVTAGYDDSDIDWQMLVLENGNGTDNSPTTYYIYVELE